MRVFDPRTVSGGGATHRRCALQRGAPDSPGDFSAACEDIDFSIRRAHMGSVRQRFVIQQTSGLAAVFRLANELNRQRKEGP